MRIDEEACIGCEECHPYCPVEAIVTGEGSHGPVSRIDQDLCVECGVCLRAGICPTDALYQPKLEWPRIVREAFSNPEAEHVGSREMGRGTEEMKTNDVTGLFPDGVVGIAVEMGRPGVGTTFKDVQIMTTALARKGVRFAPENPVTRLMADREKGTLEPDILEERALSAIIEFMVPESRTEEILRTINAASGKVETVFALDLIRKIDNSAISGLLEEVGSAGFQSRPNCKINLGLGRPGKGG